MKDNDVDDENDDLHHYKRCLKKVASRFLRAMLHPLLEVIYTEMILLLSVFFWSFLTEQIRANQILEVTTCWPKIVIRLMLVMII